jgi:hypothetical protein
LSIKFLHNGAFSSVHESLGDGIDIPKVTWRPVSAWARSIEPGDL